MSSITSNFVIKESKYDLYSIQKSLKIFMQQFIEELNFKHQCVATKLNNNVSKLFLESKHTM